MNIFPSKTLREPRNQEGDRNSKDGAGACIGPTAFFTIFDLEESSKGTEVKPNLT